MAKKPWLRVARVARLLDCRPRLIYDLVREGKLEAIRLGPRGIRIAEESVDQFLVENRFNEDQDL